MTRTIFAAAVTETVARLCIQANTRLPADGAEGVKDAPKRRRRHCAVLPKYWL